MKSEYFVGLSTYLGGGGGGGFTLEGGGGGWDLGIGGGPPLGKEGALEFGGGGARLPIEEGPRPEGEAGGPLLEGGGAGAGGPLPGAGGSGRVLFVMLLGIPPLSLCFRLVLRPFIVASLLGYVFGMGMYIWG